MASDKAVTAATTSGGNSSKQGTKKARTQEQIVGAFNQLRQEQKNLANKAAELEMELNEHNLVIETLKQVDGDRRCYRMIGGVLVERQAKDVLPALTTNQEQLTKIIQTLNQQITTKGQEINDYREKHNIRIRGQQDEMTTAIGSADVATASTGSSNDSTSSSSVVTAVDKTSPPAQSKQSQGVLVDNKS